jgi:RHS repeat-associated protein
VKGTVGGVTIAYIGNYYEWSGSTATSYYYAGSVRVAMRQGSTLSYLFADHLGSTSVVANSSGSKTAEVRYKAWGEDRYTSGTVPSGYRFTGQRNEATLGLYYYGARWYDASLGRFISADTIVPNLGDPQAWDRYAYVENNSVKFVDPTGHRPVEDDKLPPSTPTPNPTLSSIHATQTQQSKIPFVPVDTSDNVWIAPNTTPQVFCPAPTTPTHQPLTWNDVEGFFDSIAAPDLSAQPEWYKFVGPVTINTGRGPIIINVSDIGEKVDFGLKVIWSIKEFIKNGPSYVPLVGKTPTPYMVTPTPSPFVPKTPTISPIPTPTLIPH